MLLLYFVSIFLIINKINAIEWSRDEILNTNNTVYAQWNTDATSITMKVTTKTTGWLGIGFSGNPNMMGADVVICWVKDGQGYLQDRHGLPNKNGRPPIDDQSNYELLEATENDTYTSCTFRRKLNTCDKDDFTIKNGTVKVIWSWNQKDPANATVDGPESHGPINRGATNLNIIGNQIKKPDKENLKTFNITMNNITIPGYQNTLYWCKFFEMPKLEGQPQLVGYEPLISKGNDRVVHHTVIYECTGDNIEKQFSKLINDVGYDCSSVSDAFLHCQKALIVWAVGSKGEFYPEAAGFRFGSTENSKAYYVIDTHYTNPANPTTYDSSGLTLYYTEKPRKYEARMFAVGEKLYLPYLIVPPKQKEYVVVAHCSPECLKKEVPKDGIKVFGGALHSHLTGVKIIVRHFRDEVELPPLFENEHFDFHYQQTTMLDKEVTILPDDGITIECTYNTLNRNETTTGGLATTDEMCEVYIMYYPAMNLIRCFSIIDSKDIFKVVGIESVYPTKTDLDKIIIKAPPSLANKSFVDFMHSYKWNDSQVSTLQMLEYTSPKVTQCRNLSGFISGLQPVNYSNAEPYNPPDICEKQ